MSLTIEFILGKMPRDNLSILLSKMNSRRPKNNQQKKKNRETFDIRAVIHNTTRDHSYSSLGQHETDSEL